MTNLSSPSLLNARCLLVDSDIFMRRILRQMLRQTGIGEIDEVSDGAEALATIGQMVFDYHLIITELVLPILDGIGMVTRLRRSKQLPHKIPVIGYSAAITADHVLATRDAGFNEVMVRPFSSGVLNKKVNAAVLTPRAFTISPGYTGPCRRRKSVSAYLGPIRRLTDQLPPQTAAPSAASQAQLSSRLAASPTKIKPS
jgi:DNA-binding response OmpR family regulator